MRSRLNTLRWFLLNSIDYLLRRRSKRKSPKKGVVYFDIERNHWHRYLINICHFFVINDYQIVFHPRYRFMGHWSTNELIRQISVIKFSASTPENALVITDTASPGCIQLCLDYFNNHQKNANSYHVPMSMVDTQYYFGYQSRRPESPDKERKIRVFYVGNLKEQDYSNKLVSELFDCIPRNTIFKHLKKSSFYLEPPYRLTEVFGRSFNGLLIINRNNLNIPPDRLLELLNECDFILCPPGVVMPLTHFIIEGMSMGCIPVVQWGNYMSPPLEHLKNCVSFFSLSELDQRINEVMYMDRDHLMRMRNNVIEYYNKYLAPKRVVERIENLRCGDRLFLNGEIESVKLMPYYGGVSVKA